MTAGPSIDPEQFLHEQLAQASPDLMRSMLETFINTLLSAQADSVCCAEYGARSPERSNRRNGYRHRDLDARVGTVDVAVPKLREGSFFPDWLLQRRRRAEAALTTVVATCYLLGVSTRRMDKLVQSLGITGLSKSQVSEMAKDLDDHVEAFRTRPLADGPYTFLAADALTMKVREGGRVVKVAVMVATGVNADGYREILAMAATVGRSPSMALVQRLLDAVQACAFAVLQRAHGCVGVCLEGSDDAVHGAGVSEAELVGDPLV
jgi:putative transposase